MEQYIGVKVLKAKPMTRAEYNDYRGWDLPDDEKHLAGEAGMLVEYDDKEHPNHSNHAGYISWSPLTIFEESYRKIDGITFGLAIEAMKKGYKCARKGWNGKGIYAGIHLPGKHSKVTSPFIYIDTTGLDTTNKDAKKAIVPWIASQTDMLADDWVIVGANNEV